MLGYKPASGVDVDASTKKRKRASNYTDAERHAVCSAYYQWAADLPDPKSMSAVSRLNKQQVKNNMLQRIYSNQPQLRDRIKDYSKIMEVVRASKVKARQDVKVAEVSRAERTEEQDQPWYHLSIEAPRDVQRTQPAATHADRSAGAESQAESGVADPGQSYKDTAGVDVHASSGAGDPRAMDQPIHHQESAGTIRHDLVRQLVRSQQEASRHRTQAMTDTFAIMCRTLLGIAAIMQGTPIAEVMQYVTMPDATAALQPHAAVPPGSGLNTAAAPTAAPVSIARHNAVAANGSNASATQVVSGQSAVVQAFNTMPGQLEVGAAAPGIVRRGSAATINHLY